MQLPALLLFILLLCRFSYSANTIAGSYTAGPFCLNGINEHSTYLFPHIVQRKGSYILKEKIYPGNAVNGHIAVEKISDDSVLIICKMRRITGDKYFGKEYFDTLLISDKKLYSQQSGRYGRVKISNEEIEIKTTEIIPFHLRTVVKHTITKDEKTGDLILNYTCKSKEHRPDGRFRIFPYIWSKYEYEGSSIRLDTATAEQVQYIDTVTEESMCVESNRGKEGYTNFYGRYVTKEERKNFLSITSNTSFNLSWRNRDETCFDFGLKQRFTLYKENKASWFPALIVSSDLTWNSQYDEIAAACGLGYNMPFLDAVDVTIAPHYITHQTDKEWLHGVGTEFTIDIRPIGVFYRREHFKTGESWSHNSRWGVNINFLMYPIRTPEKIWQHAENWN